MRAIWIRKHGGPEVLEVRETPDPTPAEGEVRVRVKACGLNFAEVSARQGLYPDAPKPPCIVGYEGAGVIDQVSRIPANPGSLDQRTCLDENADLFPLRDVQRGNVQVWGE